MTDHFLNQHDQRPGRGLKLEQSVQRGIGSRHHLPGQLSPGEDAVYQFVTMVARGYLDRPLVPVAAG